MKLLILAIHWPVASGRYVLDALRRMGHDARSAGPVPEPPNAIWGGQVDPRHIWTPSEIDEGWTPDAVLIMDSNMGAERSGDMPWVVYGVVTMYAITGMVDVVTLCRRTGTGRASVRLT